MKWKTDAFLCSGEFNIYSHAVFWGLRIAVFCIISIQTSSAECEQLQYDVLFSASTSTGSKLYVFA